MKTKAVVFIRWANGIKDKICELHMEYTEDGLKVNTRWNAARRLGCAMMKQGFIMMVKGNQPESEGDIFGNGKKIEN